ncbi:putative secreted protein [Actinacidiphila reveromycinica]|uniref:Putative secreted protein n=1 Tax=Actinacidiphila reveromycinica TaxID=659352 RepID=A0A7U3VPA9_9ACTN|nr:chaplin [Streptomyces sp. SN-593]BBA98562.1 putative secreted protein [Streptomyces sp. SN-593]
MRQILSRSLLTVAAASSVLAATGGYAQADSGGDSTASGSPGLLSGNSVQVPVEVPVNACGNTVDAAGLLNPSFGNSCSNESSPAPTTPPRQAPPRTEAPPAPTTPPAQPVVEHHQLAETGIARHEAGFAGAAGAALLLGGALLYRRSHTAARSARATARTR